MELMAPAGSMKCALAAIKAGADAIYLGVADLTHQRDQCRNFDPGELAEISRVAHDQGVRLYLTFNSSYSSEDFRDVLDRVGLAARLAIDGVILADIGLVTTVHERYPDLRIKFSIQGECANALTARLLRDIGVTRVVLERNVSIAEAKEIKEASGLEVELFVFGYQCNSHDSLCYMGDYWSGEPCKVHCAQKMRFVDQPELSKPRRYLFMKYYSGLRYIPLFAKAGIDGLKIEGRHRSSLYTEEVTRVWREALDHYAACVRGGGTFEVHPRWVASLRHAALGFELTDGFFVDDDYQRTIIEEPSLHSKSLFVQDTARNYFETGNLKTFKRELKVGWRRGHDAPNLRASRKDRSITGLK